MPRSFALLNSSFLLYPYFFGGKINHSLSLNLLINPLYSRIDSPCLFLPSYIALSAAIRLGPSEDNPIAQCPSTVTAAHKPIYFKSRLLGDGAKHIDNITLLVGIFPVWSCAKWIINAAPRQGVSELVISNEPQDGINLIIRSTLTFFSLL